MLLLGHLVIDIPALISTLATSKSPRCNLPHRHDEVLAGGVLKIVFASAPFSIQDWTSANSMSVLQVQNNSFAGLGSDWATLACSGDTNQMAISMRWNFALP